jgi:hypothetical protein
MKKERLKLPWPDSSSKPVLNRIAAPPMNFFKNKAGAAPGIGESKISNSRKSALLVVRALRVLSNLISRDKYLLSS